MSGPSPAGRRHRQCQPRRHLRAQAQRDDGRYAAHGRWLRGSGRHHPHGAGAGGRARHGARGAGGTAKADKTELRSGDVLRAFSAVTLVTSQQRQNKRVRVEGEVLRPGDYLMPAQSTIADALAAAGGLTPAAFVFGTDFLARACAWRSRRTMNGPCATWKPKSPWPPPPSAHHRQRGRGSSRVRAKRRHRAADRAPADHQAFRPRGAADAA